MRISEFHIESYGIVAENKLLSSKVIKVFPSEDHYMSSGEIRSNPTRIETDGVRADGTAFSVAGVADTTLEATWLPFGSNRRTAPDVRRGERILIWRNSDSMNYYWTVTGQDEQLRKLETVVLAICATPNEGDDSLNLDNCYFLEVSAHNKSITFKTSTRNGEPYQYTGQLNLAEGAFILTDDINNRIELDSGDHRITFTNADGAILDINRKKILGQAAELINFKVGSEELVMTPGKTRFRTSDFDFE